MLTSMRGSSSTKRRNLISLSSFTLTPNVAYRYSHSGHTIQYNVFRRHVKKEGKKKSVMLLDYVLLDMSPCQIK